MVHTWFLHFLDYRSTHEPLSRNEGSQHFLRQWQVHGRSPNISCLSFQESFCFTSVSLIKLTLKLDSEVCSPLYEALHCFMLSFYWRTQSCQMTLSCRKGGHVIVRGSGVGHYKRSSGWWLHSPEAGNQGTGLRSHTKELESSLENRSQDPESGFWIQSQKLRSGLQSPSQESELENQSQKPRSGSKFRNQNQVSARSSKWVGA